MQKFEKGFFIGAATAAHQVEGNNTNSDYWAQGAAAPFQLLQSPAALPATIIIGTKRTSNSGPMPG